MKRTSLKIIKQDLNLFTNFINVGNFSKTEQKDLKKFIYSRSVMFVVYIICVQTYLPALAVQVGCNDFQVSIITVFPTICLLTQFLSPLIFDTLARRKKFLIALQILYATFVFAPAALPFFVGSSYLHLCMVLTAILALLIYAQYKTGVDLLLLEITKDNTRGDTIAAYRGIANILLLVLLPALGIFLDAVEDNYIGFLLVYSFCALLSVKSTLDLMKVSDVKYETKKSTFFSSVKKVVRQKNFISLAAEGFCLYFVVWLTYSFRNLYLLKYLNVNFTLYSFATNLAIVAEILFAVIWVKFARKYNWRYVFIICCVIYCVEFLIWCLINENMAHLSILAYFLAGISNSAFILSTSNLRYKIMKSENKSTYEGIYWFLIGLSSLLSPLAGNCIKTLSEMIGVKNDLQPVFMVSFLLGLTFVIYNLFHKKAKEAKS